MTATGVEILGESKDYPISPKEHGVDFLMNLRHLWMRSSQQHAVLKVRNELTYGIRDFFYRRNFVTIDSPILTPAALGHLDALRDRLLRRDDVPLPDRSALPRVGGAAHGKVYCFGPTFRAETSKTRRHLTEFWMVEPEVAWMRFPELLDLAEEFVSSLVARVLDRCKHELEWLERDISKLEAGHPPALPAHRLRRRHHQAPEQGVRRQVRRRLRRRRGDGALRRVGPADHDHPLPLRHQGVLHGARRRRPGPRPGGGRDRPRGVRRDHRRLRAHRLVRPPRAAHPASTTCRARRSSGTSTCAATAASRTPASAWASSGW